MAMPMPPLNLNTATTDTGSVMTSAANDLRQTFGGLDKSGISNRTMMVTVIAVAVVAALWARKG